MRPHLKVRPAMCFYHFNCFFLVKSFVHDFDSQFSSFDCHEKHNFESRKAVADSVYDEDSDLTKYSGAGSQTSVRRLIVGKLCDYYY